MEEIMDNDINNNKLENEILLNITKECPYCNIILSSKEYNDHILCHEIDQNENGNLSNNINGFGLKKMNNNYETNKETKSSNVFSGFLQKIDNLIKNKNNDNENKEINCDNNINNQNNCNKFSLSSLFNRNNDSDSDSYSDEEKIGDKFKPIFDKVANFFKRRDDNDSGSSDNESPTLLRGIPFFRRRSNSEDNIDYNNNEEDNSDDLLNDELFNKNESKELLKYIPTSVVSKEKKPSDSNYRCIICLSEFQVGEKESILPCLHIFHSACIETWINNKQWCPICKYDISLKSLLSKNNY
jgi:hypothetical protein